MTINLQKPDITELKPRITVFGVGGGGGNAVNNMIETGLRGVEFVVANTDSQALSMSKAERVVQMGVHVTEGLGAGSQPEIGAAAAEECMTELNDHLDSTHMCFVTAGMGGGTGTGAAPVVARAARERGILTVGVVTKPFHFEGQRRMRIAQAGIDALMEHVDTLIVIPNQNLFRVANDKTTFTDAFAMADQVLYSGVASITDLMVKQGLVNLDFADVRSVMRDMGKAMMGTGEASGEGRALAAAEAAIANPLLDESSMRGARGLLISITGGPDMTLFELDEAANRIREEVDEDANIIMGATYDEELDGAVRVSVVATGIDSANAAALPTPQPQRAAAKPVPAPVPAQPVQTARPMQPPAPASRPAPQAVAAPARAAPAAPAAAVAPAASVDLSRELETAVATAVRTDGPATPSVEDFSPQVQANVRAASHGYPPTGNAPMGLLKRITTGLARREDAEHETEHAVPAAAETRAPAPAASVVADMTGSAPSPVAQPAMRSSIPVAASGTSGTLDQHGRAPAASTRLSSDEELDIPAFLRRSVG